MTRVGVRPDRLEARIPIPVPVSERRLDLSRLTDEQLDRLEQLNERIVTVGPDGLTTDETMEAADLLAILEGDPAP